MNFYFYDDGNFYLWWLYFLFIWNIVRYFGKHLVISRNKHIYICIYYLRNCSVQCAGSGYERRSFLLCWDVFWLKWTKYTVNVISALVRFHINTRYRHLTNVLFLSVTAPHNLKRNPYITSIPLNLYIFRRETL